MNVYRIALFNQNRKTRTYPANINLFKVNNKNSRKRYEICSKLTIKTPERRQWRRSGVYIVKLWTYFTPFFSVSIVNFEQANVSWVVPIHKKNDRQCLENYRPVSLLPICGKFVEHLIFNEIFLFFIKNGIILPNQSGFKSGDSCVNEHLSITHEIYKSFDGEFDVRSVSLDISKAFYKVWYEGIIFN